VRFEESSDGLPDAGSWRNGGAVADMNGDGNPDIVLPPQRAGNGIPAIFVGDGKGGFREVFHDRAFPSRRLVATDVDRDGWTG
jgi:hypothetical protein